MMATISPPVRPLETVAHEVKKSERLRVHRDDGGQKGKLRGRSPPPWASSVCPLMGEMGGWVRTHGKGLPEGCPEPNTH